MDSRKIIVILMILALVLLLSGCKYYETYSDDEDKEEGADSCIPELDGDCQEEFNDSAIASAVIADIDLDSKATQSVDAQIKDTTQIAIEDEIAVVSEEDADKTLAGQSGLAEVPADEEKGTRVIIVGNEEDEGSYNNSTAAQTDVSQANASSPDAVKPNAREYPTKTVIEGELVSFASIRADDADGDTVRVKFSSPLNKSGEWLTADGDAGEYETIIEVSDSKTMIEQKVIIIVKAMNKPPMLTVPTMIEVDEGEAVLIEVQAEDRENDPVTISFSGWMKNDKYQTTFDDAGTYKVVVVASDGLSESRKEVLIEINDVNREPVLDLSGLVD